MKRPRPTAILAMACCLLVPVVLVKADDHASKSKRKSKSAAPAPVVVVVGSITAITEPLTRQVVQRRDDNVGTILFAGTYAGNVDGFQASSTLEVGMTGTPLGWTALVDVTILNGNFYGILRQPAGGFYDFEIRPVYQGQPGSSMSVSTVGVGEVFLTAGQSNTTNWGTPTGFLPSPLVSCFDEGVLSGTETTYPGSFWRYGVDPQPAFDKSAGGSVWPAMATNLALALDVPIGMYAVGAAGTRVAEWLPGYVVVPAGPDNPPIILFDRLTNAISYFTSRGGFRAVLWHQGESDYYAGTSELVYGSSLQYLIDQSRAVTGVPVKWMVATAASWMAVNMDERTQIEQAQASVIDNILTFPGPDNDSIGLSMRIYTNGQPVHFTAPGLMLMGGYWAIYITNIPGFLGPGNLPPG